ncbi:MAG: ISNCY family transposase, partial [Gammaproteobacteria bacterium]|nr:ISNCY family transposase [Gammaproteobacteria bacterium]
MRAKRASQRSFVDVGYPNHEMGRVLERISTLLDSHPEFLDWISADVDRGRRSRRGRAGLPCEVILRCGILKQLWQADY